MAEGSRVTGDESQAQRDPEATSVSAIRLECVARTPEKTMAMLPLTELWTKSPEQLEGKKLEQIIAFAGSGKLSDKSPEANEFREFLSHVPSEHLVAFADECLHGGFKTSGLALQDIVNQVGRRLGFNVEDGRYRGAKGQIGFDGLWRTEEGHALVIEVKTTDAYRMDLDVQAGYREALVASGRIDEHLSSILFVVGRKDTGDLEAQIRGSRHAWDIRVISVDALLKLMKLKEELEDPLIVKKIGAILTPQEYTRVDGIIDVVFSTAEDVKAETEPDDTNETPESSSREATKHRVAFNAACVQRVREHLGRNLVKQSRVGWRSPDGTLALLCTVSRAYERPDGLGYWYTYHLHQRAFLEEAREAYAAFGCGSKDKVLLVPRDDLNSWTEGMNATSRGGRSCWHVKIHEQQGRFSLQRRSGTEAIDLSRYLLVPRPTAAAPAPGPRPTSA